MKKQTYYEYDEESQVLIRIPDNGSPQIISKAEPQWRYLGPSDDMYARAIYLGQGCWESLTTISEEEGQRILLEWGCPHE